MTNNESTRLIGIIYRDNDAFTVFVPEIVKILEMRGYSINVTIVSKGTRSMEGRKITEVWKKSLPKGTRTLSDGTCRLWGLLEKGGQLDFIVGDCAATAFLGVDQKQVEDHLKKQCDSLEKAKTVFQKAIVAVGKKIGVPAVVRVSPDHLNDHQPFVAYEFDPFKETRMPNDEAVDCVQSWVREIYPDCKFDCKSVDEQATWIVRDRHASGTTFMDERGHLLLSFCLPVENMVLGLASLGLLPPVIINDEMINQLGRRLPE